MDQDGKILRHRVVLLLPGWVRFSGHQGRRTEEYQNRREARRRPARSHCLLSLTKDTRSWTGKAWTKVSSTGRSLSRSGRASFHRRRWRYQLTSWMLRKSHSIHQSTALCRVNVSGAAARLLCRKYCRISVIRVQTVGNRTVYIDTCFLLQVETAIVVNSSYVNFAQWLSWHRCG